MGHVAEGGDGADGSRSTSTSKTIARRSRHQDIALYGKTSGPAAGYFRLIDVAAVNSLHFTDYPVFA
ncbi:hypothetical protein AJ87_23555 [Rhizobium yanglingense]|nr:hypothetical protein AJ87_23555 [Rhizobium yanglingense]